ETMTTEVEPGSLTLEAGETGSATVKVKVSERVADGGYEKQRVLVTPDGRGDMAEKLVLRTVRRLDHPYILHTDEGWKKVQEKIENHEWAEKIADNYIERAGKWTVPEVRKPPNNTSRSGEEFLFRQGQSGNLEKTAIAWKLTGKKKYARKVATFLLRLSNPEDGYPTTMKACHKRLVHEGAFFQDVGAAYDLIYDAGVLEESEHEQIQRTLRLWINFMDWQLGSGSYSNWSVSMLTGAMFCSLSMQDLHMVNRFIKGPGGFDAQLQSSLMDDGWWGEGAVGYTTWVARMYSRQAKACEPFGFNLWNRHVPAVYHPDRSIRPRPAQHWSGPAEKWGPSHRNYRAIRDFWDSLIPFMDYRGVLLANNDATEAKECGPYEIAYYHWRDPDYAWVVNRAREREGLISLLYGVPEIPEAEDPRDDSAYADNIGIAALRSQGEDQSPREQIQAALKYGSHGGAHGHFDRTNFLSLMRYGRSFYNPELTWYGYSSFMYRFFIESSINHNMVVVDGKEQEPRESKRLLFHDGDMLQAAAVQTNTRWSYPPFGGIEYGWFDGDFEEKTWSEGRHVPIPDDAPEYEERTGWTERILQRRLMLVTDDYVVLADYLEGDEDHTYDWLIHGANPQGLHAEEKELLRRTEQYFAEPLSSGQFLTSCEWYRTTAPVRYRYRHVYENGKLKGRGNRRNTMRSNHNEDGVLNVSVRLLWPKQPEVMTAIFPDNDNASKKLWYEVRSRDEKLASGKFGAWILGRDDLDINVEDMDQVTLQTRSDPGRWAQRSLFWGNPRIETADGETIYLADIQDRLSRENVARPDAEGKDYFGGPVRIQGRRFKKPVGASPQDWEKPARITVDLSGLNAVRLKASVGGDYPLGGEAHRQHHTLAARTEGEEARYLAVVEPYESGAKVEKARALGPNHLRITLSDGRTQEIKIKNFEGDGQDISATITEKKDGEVLRSETAGENAN
ncbi:MAG: hypothetical protein V5A84_02755, partial [Planctomycetota bacterium]